MIRLILNGDDLGMSHEVNAGILLAHTEGLLTSASLMVNGDAVEEAIDLVRRHPSLEVGLHLVLIQGRATLSPALIPRLVDAQGSFGTSPFPLGMRYFFNRQIRPEIEAEVRAQIEKFLAFGLPLSHVNGHLHFHLHPTVLRILLKLSREYPIKSMRLTHDRFWVNVRFDRRNFASKAVHYLIFALLSRYARGRLDREGIAYADRVYGLLQTGKVDERYLLYLLDHLEDATSEIYFHPAIGGFELQRKFMPGYRHKEELSALISQTVKDRMIHRGIERTGHLALSEGPVLVK